MKTVWTEDMEIAFDTLKNALCEVCTLTIPTAEDQYIIHTDASYAGVGGVLSVCRDGQEWPVVFHSRQLRSPEKNYSASEIECLAIVDTVRHFEIHLVG